MALARTLRLGPTARRFVIEPVLGAVFPTPCVACKRLLDEPGVGLLCPDCVASIRRFTGSACRCGTPLPGAGEQDAVCGRCRRGATAWSRGASLGPHEDVLRSAIHALKYGGRRRLARQLASALLEGGRT
jgi:predicted amidophosphoribosyltransferase